MAVAGELIVSLRAHAASFHAELGKAGNNLRDLGGHINSTEHTLARFASRLSNEVVPGLGGIVHAAATARGALSALQPVVIGLVAGLGGFALGNIIQNFSQLRQEGHGFVEAMKLAVGSTKDFEDRMRLAAEDEAKLAEQLRTAGSLRLGFAKQLAASSSEAAVSARQLSGDEIGAAQETLQGKLAALEIEREERERTNILSKLRAQDLTEFLKKNDGVYLAARHAAHLKNAVDLKKVQDDLTAKQVQKWKDETGELIAQLKARISARDNFESQKGVSAATLGVDRSVSGGLKEIRDLNANVDKSMRDLADDIREGNITERDAFDERLRIRESFVKGIAALRQKFSGSSQVISEIVDEGNLAIFKNVVEEIPAIEPVLDALNRLVSDKGFGNFGNELDRGRQFIEQFIASSSQLNDALDSVRDRLTVGVPEAVDQASSEFQKLKRDFQELATSISAVNTTTAQTFQAGNAALNAYTQNAANLEAQFRRTAEAARELGQEIQ